MFFVNGQPRDPRQPMSARTQAIQFGRVDFVAQQAIRSVEDQRDRARYSSIVKMVSPGRFELPTSGLGNRCSIHLSYGAVRRF